MIPWPRWPAVSWRSAGYTVTLAASAPEALRCFEQSDRLDLVVTDIVMPGGMNGVELGSRLRAARPTLPVLYMSGYTDDAQIPSDGLGGHLPFLPKPFQPEDLLRQVAELLSPR